MERKTSWTEIDAVVLGFAVATALRNLEAGERGEVLLELNAEERYPIDSDQGKDQLGGVVILSRWLKIVSDPDLKRVVIFEVEPPIELTSKERENT